MYFTARRSAHDLALATNPLGCSPLVAKHRISAEGMELYPHAGHEELSDQVALRFGTSGANVMLGGGIDGLLHQIVVRRLGSDTRLILPSVTFPKMAAIASGRGTTIIRAPMAPDLSIDFDALLSTVEEDDCIYIANPSNPTGISEPPGRVMRLCGATRGLVILDEANAEFDEAASCARRAPDVPNLVVLRTLSKAYGLASLRVGYALGEQGLIASLRHGAPRFPIAGLSAKLASIALADDDHLAASVQHIDRARTAMIGRLTGDGAWCTRSSANCLVMRLPEDRPPFHFIDFCRDRGVGILAGTEFGLPDDHFRVSPQSEAANEALASALASFLGNRTKPDRRPAAIVGRDHSSTA